LTSGGRELGRVEVPPNGDWVGCGDTLLVIAPEEPRTDLNDAEDDRIFPNGRTSLSAVDDDATESWSDFCKQLQC
jgi:hypothetical protein